MVAKIDQHPSAAVLEGLPLTIKDCIDVAGLRTTAGVEALRGNNVATEDAPLAASVIGAGGVLIGKTNVPPNASDWQVDNPLFGAPSTRGTIGARRAAARAVVPPPSPPG